MKKILFICMAFLALVSVQAQNDQRMAEKAYVKGDYQRVIQIYESLLKEKGESSDLYYNLGNAYYKADQIAPAILNYERALLLAPGDEDIRQNLEIARMKTVDKITPIGSFLLADWVHSIQMRAGSNGWAVIAAFLFILFIAALFMYFFSGRIWMKKVAFFGGTTVFLFCVFANYFAYAQKQQLTDRNHAIIFTPSVVVKSTPDESGTDLFVVHQGTKVTLQDKVGEWTRVQLEDGNDGWLKEVNLKQI